MILKEIENKDLFHTYICESSDSDIVRNITAALKKAYPEAELYAREFDLFGVDDSRELFERASVKSANGQCFVYKIHKITSEAQNALLKLLEEPAPHTHFFFCFPYIGSLMPTVLSRARVIKADGTGGDATESVLNLSKKELIEKIGELADEKDINGANDLLKNIEREAYAKALHKTHTDLFIHIANVRRALQGSGTSIKMLLESVVLLLP